MSNTPIQPEMVFNRLGDEITIPPLYISSRSTLVVFSADEAVALNLEAPAAKKQLFLDQHIDAVPKRWYSDAGMPGVYYSSAIHDDGGIFCVKGDTLFKFDPVEGITESQLGARSWFSLRVEKGSNLLEPVQDDSHLYVVTTQGTVYKLGKADGKVASGWPQSIGGNDPVLYPPMLQDGTLYLIKSNTIYAIDTTRARTDKILWYSELGLPGVHPLSNGRYLQISTAKPMSRRLRRLDGYLIIPLSITILTSAPGPVGDDCSMGAEVWDFMYLDAADGTIRPRLLNASKRYNGDLKIQEFLHFDGENASSLSYVVKCATLPKGNPTAIEPESLQVGVLSVSKTGPFPPLRQYPDALIMQNYNDQLVYLTTDSLSIVDMNSLGVQTYELPTKTIHQMNKGLCNYGISNGDKLLKSPDGSWGTCFSGDFEDGYLNWSFSVEGKNLDLKYRGKVCRLTDDLSHVKAWAIKPYTVLIYWPASDVSDDIMNTLFDVHDISGDGLGDCRKYPPHREIRLKLSLSDYGFSLGENPNCHTQMLVTPDSKYFMFVATTRSFQGDSHVLALVYRFPESGEVVGKPINHKTLRQTEDTMPLTGTNHGLNKAFMITFSGTKLQRMDAFTGEVKEFALDEKTVKQETKTGYRYFAIKNAVLDQDGEKLIMRWVAGIPNQYNPSDPYIREDCLSVLNTDTMKLIEGFTYNLTKQPAQGMKLHRAFGSNGAIVAVMVGNDDDPENISAAAISLDQDGGHSVPFSFPLPMLDWFVPSPDGSIVLMGPEHPVSSSEAETGGAGYYFLLHMPCGGRQPKVSQRYVTEKDKRIFNARFSPDNTILFLMQGKPEDEGLQEKFDLTAHKLAPLWLLQAGQDFTQSVYEKDYSIDKGTLVLNSWDASSGNARITAVPGMTDDPYWVSRGTRLGACRPGTGGGQGEAIGTPEELGMRLSTDIVPIDGEKFCAAGVGSDGYPYVAIYGKDQF